MKKKDKKKMADGGLKTTNDFSSLSPIYKKAYPDEKEYSNGGTKMAGLFDKLRKKIRKSTGQKEPFQRPKGQEVDQKKGGGMFGDEENRRMVEEINEMNRKKKKK